MLKYKDYQYLIEFDNGSIYIEMQNELTNKKYSLIINDKYIKENIKLIKKLEDVFNIIKIGFNKIKSKNIKLNIIDNEKTNIELFYNIYYEQIDINIEFTLILNEIFTKEIELEENDIKKELILLKRKYDILWAQYLENENKPYYFDGRYFGIKEENITLSKKNKHFYISVSNWPDLYELKSKFIKIINYNVEYKIIRDSDNFPFTYLKFINERPNYEPIIDITSFNCSKFITIYSHKGYDIYDPKKIQNGYQLFNANTISILYDIKHLILRNICLNYGSIKNLNIHKYEIIIDLDFFNKTYENRTYEPLLYTLLTRNITDYSNFILKNCKVDYLILNQDMWNFVEILINKDYTRFNSGLYIYNSMSINKGIILNNCIELSKNIELIKYCKENKLDLIINNGRLI